MNAQEREELRADISDRVVTYDWQREDFERALDEYAQAVAAPLVEALRVEMEDARERARGSTHWPGCSANHRECATYERIEAALANYEAGK